MGNFLSKTKFAKLTVLMTCVNNMWVSCLQEEYSCSFGKMALLIPLVACRLPWRPAIVINNAGFRGSPCLIPTPDVRHRPLVNVIVTSGSKCWTNIILRWYPEPAFYLWLSKLGLIKCYKCNVFSEWLRPCRTMDRKRVQKGISNLNRNWRLSAILSAFYFFAQENEIEKTFFQCSTIKRNLSSVSAFSLHLDSSPSWTKWPPFNQNFTEVCS